MGGKERDRGDREEKRALPPVDQGVVLVFTQRGGGVDGLRAEGACAALRPGRLHRRGSCSNDQRGAQVSGHSEHRSWTLDRVASRITAMPSQQGRLDQSAGIWGRSGRVAIHI